MFGRVRHQVLPGHRVGGRPVQHPVDVLDRLGGQPGPEIGRHPAPSEAQHRGPRRVDTHPARCYEAGRCRAEAVAFGLVLGPVGEHRGVAVGLDPSLGEQSPVQEVQHRHPDVLQPPVADDRVDISPDVVGVVLPRRGLHRVTHGRLPLGEERPHRAPGHPDTASAAVTLLRGHRCGPGIGLRLEPAPVLPLPLARQRVRFHVQAVVPARAALMDCDALGWLCAPGHAAVVSPIMASSRDVTMYTHPPRRRTGSSRPPRTGRPMRG